MQNTLLAVCALACAGNVQAECDTLRARFEGESTRVALTTLADVAGFRIANPEVIHGRLDAELESDNPSLLFPRLAAALGYALQIRGSTVWLQPLTDQPAASAG